MERLPDWCQPVVSLGDDDVPLCLPVHTTDAASFREFLTRHRIYTATYWKGLDMESQNTFERSLSTETLFLPCDQRYGEAEMSRVAHLLHAFRGDAQHVGR